MLFMSFQSIFVSFSVTPFSILMWNLQGTVMLCYFMFHFWNFKYHKNLYLNNESWFCLK